VYALRWGYGFAQSSITLGRASTRLDNPQAGAGTLAAGVRQALAEATEVRTPEWRATAQPGVVSLCRPNAPFAELVRLSRTSIADEMREEHRRRVLGE
jgi:hypothetical protein